MSNYYKKKPKVSNKIKIDNELCSGCSICELACSLFHEGICQPELSRIRIFKEFLSLEFNPQTCIQCDWPACYLECPTGAIKIDIKTGARYISAAVCIGCGKCVDVCPIKKEVKAINFKKIGRKKYILNVIFAKIE